MSDIPYFADALSSPHYDQRFFQGQVPNHRRHQILSEALEVFHTACTQMSVTPVVVHRSLLGHALNDNQLLPWDDKVQIVVTYDDLQKMAIGKPEYDSSAYLLDLNPNFVNRCSLNAHHLQTLEANAIDARFIDRCTGLFIEVTAAIISGDMLITKCPHRWRYDDVFPAQQSTLMGTSVFIPRSSKRLLEMEFGDLRESLHELWIFKYLRSLGSQKSEPMPELKGRGIITCASDKYLPFVQVLLASLRSKGCELPVEVWHHADEIHDPSIPQLQQFGPIRCCEFPAEFGAFKGWATKPAAILCSRFAQILFLDADNSVVFDPTHLFETSAFMQHGAVLWPDAYHGERRDAELRWILGLPTRFTFVESGQLLIDKTRHWAGLACIAELNRLGKVIYRYIYGDKDSFAMGFEMAGEPYTVLKMRPRSSTLALEHYWVDGNVLFRHRGSANAKFVNLNDWTAAVLQDSKAQTSNSERLMLCGPN